MGPGLTLYKGGSSLLGTTGINVASNLHRDIEALTPEDWNRIRRAASNAARLVRIEVSDLIHDAVVTALGIKERYRGPNAAGFLSKIIKNHAMNQSTLLYGRGDRLGRKALMSRYRNGLESNFYTGRHNGKPFARRAL